MECWVGILLAPDIFLASRCRSASSVRDDIPSVLQCVCSDAESHDGGGGGILPV